MEALKYPRKIAIGFQEGTCPLHCNKCLAFGQNANGMKKMGKMSLEDAKRLIDEIATFHDGETISYIQPHIFTEPFANKELKDIICYCNQKAIGMSIITNGLLIDDDWEAFILNEMGKAYTISFSLDAATQDTYKIVRGEMQKRQYALLEIEERIMHLLDNRKNNAPRIIVNFGVEEDNEMEQQAFLDKWKYKVDAVSIGTCLDKNRKIPEKYRNPHTNLNRSCPNLFEVMAIDYDGSVRTCQYDAFGTTMLGNVFQDGIYHVWHGEKIEKLRALHNANSLTNEYFCFGCEAKCINGLSPRETEEFYIKEGDNMIFYNKK